jgi:hypothetical protein
MESVVIFMDRQKFCILVIGKLIRGPYETLMKYIFVPDNDERGVMLPGMTFTIEPILTLGNISGSFEEFQ